MPSGALMRRMGARRIPIHPSALAWKNAVIAAGGGTPSLAIVQAYSTFFYGLDNDGFTYTGGSPDIVFFNAFYPTSLIGAMIPQINASVTGWTNRNFVIGDLTVDGLKGNGTNKSISTPYVSQTYWSDTSAGLSAMVTAAVAENTTDIGLGGNNVNSQYGLLCNFATGIAHFECWRFDAPNLASGALPSSPINGFRSGSRTSANAGNIYFANTGNPIASIGSMAGPQTGAANMGGGQTLEIFALNTQGIVSNWSSKRLSMVAGHKGFTLAQTTLFFNRCQNLRAGLGGGTV